MRQELIFVVGFSGYPEIRTKHFFYYCTFSFPKHFRVRGLLARSLALSSATSPMIRPSSMTGNGLWVWSEGRGELRGVIPRFNSSRGRWVVLGTEVIT